MGTVPSVLWNCLRLHDGTKARSYHEDQGPATSRKGEPCDFVQPPVDMLRGALALVEMGAYVAVSYSEPGRLPKIGRPKSVDVRFGRLRRGWWIWSMLRQQQGARQRVDARQVSKGKEQERRQRYRWEDQSPRDGGWVGQTLSIEEFRRQGDGQTTRQEAGKHHGLITNNNKEVETWL